MSVGREEEKEGGLRVIIIYLLLLELIVRSQEESQDNIVLRLDWTTQRRSRGYRMGEKNVICIKSESSRRR